MPRTTATTKANDVAAASALIVSLNPMRVSHVEGYCASSMIRLIGDID
jgi:hypothetical protein